MSNDRIAKLVSRFGYVDVRASLWDQATTPSR